MTGRARYWLLTHPRVGRPLTVLAWVQLLSCLAVGTAPDAAASTNAVVLNWTGLHDSYGVPAGDLYLSVASLADRLTQTGPQASVVNPGTWVPWMMHSVAVMFDRLTAANILTAEIGVFVGIFTLAMWVFRLTVSTYWLTVLGELARAITTAVISVTTRWGLVALTVPTGVFMGVLAIRRGERGRGATMLMLALFMPGLAVSVFSDPAGLMYGPNGLLQFGRRMAFSTAQAATHGGAISGGGFGGQIDTLTSSLITSVVREPLEVFNFGHVVDRVGGCGAMVSTAWRQGAGDGPITALTRCGDTAAVHYAQNLDGTNVLGGLVLVITAALFGWFMVSAGASVFMVSVKAIWTTAKLLPSVFAGGIDGGAREHAKSTVWQFFKHPIEAMVYITFVSVIGLAVERLISRPLPAELGGPSPFAHVLIMGGASLVALYLLRHIRADLEGTRPRRGIVGRAGDVALGMGMHAAFGGASKAALGGARGVRGLLGRGGKTPWERMDERAATAAASAQDVLGPAQEGFDPVPGEDPAGRGGAAGQSAPAAGSPTAPAAAPTRSASSAQSGGEAVPAISPAPPTGPGFALDGRGGNEPDRQPRRPRRAAEPRPPAAEASPVLDLSPSAAAARSAPAIAPISDPARARPPRQQSPHHIPAMPSYVDHTADVPPPTDAPSEDDLHPPPPPADPWPPAATVDPVPGLEERP